MPISEHDREAMRAAWTGFCGALKQTGDDALDGKIGDPRDADELAELLRAIGRLASLAPLSRCSSGRWPTATAMAAPTRTSPIS